MQNITIAIVSEDAAMRQTMRDAVSASDLAIVEYDMRMVASLDGIKGAYAACVGFSEPAHLQAIQSWKSRDPRLPIIVCGPENLGELALQQGAYDFVPTTTVGQRLVRVVKHAVEKRRLTDTVDQLRNELTTRDHGEGNAVVPLRELEHRAIGRALKATNGSVTKAAKLLGIGRATLYRRLASPELANLRPRRGFENNSSPTA